MTMVYKLLNFIGFQVGWFACVLGAANGYPWLGPAVVMALAAANLVARRRFAADLLLVVLAAVLGYAVDSVLVIAGILQFDAAAQLGRPSTVWMVAMWVNIALTLNASLGWLQGRYVLAAVLGAVAGPPAYLAGARLGAVDFAAPVAISLLVVSVEWLVSMPALLGLSVLARRVVARGDMPVVAGEEKRR